MGKYTDGYFILYICVGILQYYYSHWHMYLFKLSVAEFMHIINNWF